VRVTYLEIRQFKTLTILPILDPAPANAENEVVDEPGDTTHNHYTRDDKAELKTYVSISRGVRSVR